MLIQYEAKASSLGALLQLHQKRLRSQRVTDLSVVYCGIRSIGELPAFACILTLQSLKMNHCELVNLAGIDKLPNLRELQAKYNSISSISPLGKLEHLRKLNLVGNPVCQDREDFAWLVRQTKPHLKTINGEDAAIYFKTIIKEDSSKAENLHRSQSSVRPISKRSLPLVVLPSSMHLPTNSEARSVRTFESGQLITHNITQQSEFPSRRNTLRLEAGSLPIFQKSQQSQHISEKENYDMENVPAEDSLFMRKREKRGQDPKAAEINEIDSALNDLSDLFRRQSLFSKVVQGLTAARAFQPQKNAHYQQQHHPTIPHTNWLVQCFFTLKNNYEKARAYRRLAQRQFLEPEQDLMQLPMSFRDRPNPTRQSMPLQLNIEMINDTFQGTSKTISQKFR